MLYLDHCATTVPYDEVIESIVQVSKKYYGNPSSLHHFGVEAERLVKRAREVIADHLHIQPESIIFTSGGTESNNLAIKGVAYEYQQRGKHLITTQIEHASVYECFRQLEQEGFRVTYLPVNASGMINIQDLADAICEDTILVSVMHVNNEVGSIQPIEQIGKLLKNYPRIQFHVDAVQSIGKVDIYPVEWGIDLMTLSAHKLRGPKGIGLLYCREGLRLRPLIVGGGQEKGIRSGTENVPHIVAMAKAIRMTMEEKKKKNACLWRLREKLQKGIQQIPELTINGSLDSEKMAPHIINFSFPQVKSEVFVHALEKHGIVVSTRSACSSGDEKPSRVLKAMGHDDDRASSGIRICISYQQTEADIDFVIDRIQSVVKELKEGSL